MTDLKNKLENYVAIKPHKISGNAIIDGLKGKIRPVIESKRCEVVEVLSDWLSKRSEPLTMYAVELVRCFNLIELRSQLTELLEEIHNKDLFEPYYASWVSRSLGSLGAERGPKKL